VSAAGGRYFEDFTPGETIVHATPRTVSEADATLYLALFGTRVAVGSSTPFARAAGFARAPLDDLLAFHLVFGRTVPDVSRNAIANLGYADGRFGAPVYPGDTLAATSQVLGVRRSRDGATGVVYVRTRGTNQDGALVVEYVRWVLVRTRDAGAPPPASPVPAVPAVPAAAVPTLPEAVAADALVPPPPIAPGAYDLALAGSVDAWEDYAVGERIDHVDGMTIEESDHMTATRLYQNTARVHFDAHAERGGRFGRRIVYGGHVISLARALSFNGLANAYRVLAINGGRHVHPTFAGDTIHAWTEVLEQIALPGRDDVGALRLRTVATKDRPCDDFPRHAADGSYLSEVVLDLDYTVALPRARSTRPGGAPTR
jgi:2-methylfumaryl-CoA hydratase